MSLQLTRQLENDVAPQGKADQDHWGMGAPALNLQGDCGETATARSGRAWRSYPPNSLAIQNVAHHFLLIPLWAATFCSTSSQQALAFSSALILAASRLSLAVPCRGVEG